MHIPSNTLKSPSKLALLISSIFNRVKLFIDNGSVPDRVVPEVSKFTNAVSCPTESGITPEALVRQRRMLSNELIPANKVGIVPLNVVCCAFKVMRRCNPAMFSGIPPSRWRIMLRSRSSSVFTEECGTSGTVPLIRVFESPKERRALELNRSLGSVPDILACGWVRQYPMSHFANNEGDKVRSLMKWA